MSIHGATKRPGIQWRKGPGGKTKWPILLGLEISRLHHPVNPVPNMSASGNVSWRSFTASYSTTSTINYLETYSKPTQCNSTTLEHSSGSDTTQPDLPASCNLWRLASQAHYEGNNVQQWTNASGWKRPHQCLQCPSGEESYFHLLCRESPRNRCTANKLRRWRPTW